MPFEPLLPTPGRSSPVSGPTHLVPHPATDPDLDNGRIVIVAPSALIGQGLAELVGAARPDMTIEPVVRRGLRDTDVADDVRLVVQYVRFWPDAAADVPRVWLERVPVLLALPRPDPLAEAAARRAGYAAVVAGMQGAGTLLARIADLLDLGDPARSGSRSTGDARAMSLLEMRP